MPYSGVEHASFCRPGVHNASRNDTRYPNTGNLTGERCASRKCVVWTPYAVWSLQECSGVILGCTVILLYRKKASIVIAIVLLPLFLPCVFAFRPGNSGCPFVR